MENGLSVAIFWDGWEGKVDFVLMDTVFWFL